MAYATQDQIQKECGGTAGLLALTDQESAGSINTSVLCQAQENAESWMHGFLNDRFTTPITPTTTDGANTLRRISAQETIYQLILMSPMRTVGESDKLKREQRELELKAFSDGQRRPMDPGSPQASVVQAVTVPFTGHVTRRGLRGIW